MKKSLFFLLLIASALNGLAQTETGPSKKKKRQNEKTETVILPAPPPTPVNAVDSFSYALGVSMAMFYKSQGVSEINAEMVTQALKDVRGDTAQMNEAACNEAILSYIQKAKSEKAAGNKKLGQAFLDSNKTQPGIVSLASGLQYRIVKEGTGDKPALTDRVKVHYSGSLINGKIFDSSIQRGKPIDLNVDGVIPGWTEALQLMPVGSQWQLFIPSDLAYGDNDAGADIKAGSTLIFDVELLEILK